MKNFDLRKNEILHAFDKIGLLGCLRDRLVNPQTNMNSLSVPPPVVAL